MENCLVITENFSCPAATAGFPNRKLEYVRLVSVWGAVGEVQDGGGSGLEDLPARAAKHKSVPGPTSSVCPSGRFHACQHPVGVEAASSRRTR